jgi:hypothetical protein
VASSGEAVGTDLELSSEVNRDQIAANNIYRSSPAVNSGCEQVVSQTRTEIDRLKDDKDWVPARAFVVDMAAAVGVKIVSRHVLGGLECQARSHRVNVAAEVIPLETLGAHDISGLFEGTLATSSCSSRSTKATRGLSQIRDDDVAGGPKSTVDVP